MAGAPLSRPINYIKETSIKDNRVSSKMNKRNWIQIGSKVAAALALTVPTWTQAQGAYPNRPIKIVLPYCHP